MDILDKIFPKLGDRIGRYELVEELGRGAFGAVYRARQVGLDAEVAVKIMIPQASSPSMQFQARFEREAHVLRKLEHPASLKVRDYGKTAEGLPYLVTEFVRGRTMKAEIEEGPMSVERVIHIGIQVCGSLAEAHHHGVIHRDLKPDNIMVRHIVGSEDAVKVLDFGIAKVKGDKQVKTVTGTAFGTPWYMAPEQARGSKEIDGRADLYALGLILAECLTAKRVVDADDMMSAVIRHASPEPLTFGWDVQASPLWPAIHQATHKLRELRFDNALAMRDALRELERSLWSTPSDGVAKPAPFPPATRKIPRLTASQTPVPVPEPVRAVVRTTEHSSPEVDTLVGQRREIDVAAADALPAEGAGEQRPGRLIVWVAIACALVLLATVLVLRPWRGTGEVSDQSVTPSSVATLAPPARYPMLGDAPLTARCGGIEVDLGHDVRHPVPLANDSISRDLSGATAIVVAIVSLYDRASLELLGELIRSLDALDERPGLQIRFHETPPATMQIHRFLLAAHQQGRAWHVIGQLTTSERIDNVALDSAFRSADLDGQRFNDAVSSNAVQRQLAADAELAERYRETFHTAVFVNGRLVADSLEAILTAVIADERRRLAPLIDAGITGVALYDCVQTVATDVFGRFPQLYLSANEPGVDVTITGPGIRLAFEGLGPSLESHAGPWLPVGDYTVVFAKSGRRDQVVEVSLHERQTIEADLEPETEE